MNSYSNSGVVQPWRVVDTKKQQQQNPPQRQYHFSFLSLSNTPNRKENSTDQVEMKELIGKYPKNNGRNHNVKGGGIKPLVITVNTKSLIGSGSTSSSPPVQKKQQKEARKESPMKLSVVKQQVLMEKNGSQQEAKKHTGGNKNGIMKEEIKKNNNRSHVKKTYEQCVENMRKALAVTKARTYSGSNNVTLSSILKRFTSKINAPSFNTTNK